MNDRIDMVSPLLPDLGPFNRLLEDIWEKRWLTNNGTYVQELEGALCKFLHVKYLSLYTNGTLPMVIALKALDIKGEVITTPFSFAATAHAIAWNGLHPVFADIDPVTCNMDPDRIEAAITPQTEAIMPVHCFGEPCDTERIQAIADRHGLKVIYDAAHAFGVEVNGQSVLECGDMSSISFHATKVYNTLEGGALVCHDRQMLEKVSRMRNFGIDSETEIPEIGLNAKMDEVRAAFGLLNLENVQDAILCRRTVCQTYHRELKDVDGIRMIEPNVNVRYNYAYFPIFVDAGKFGRSRDSLYCKLRDNGIICRKYFHPLLSNLPMYRSLRSSDIANLPVANRISEEVICLPIHHRLTESEQARIIDCIRQR